MKKLFTMIALLACFLGAKAVTIVDAEVDFSQMADGSSIKFYGWGASESARARLSIKNGCLHFESTEATDPSWDCQFYPIGGVDAEVDVVYTLHYKIKGDHAANVSMVGFGQTPYGQFPITTEWVEGTVDYLCSSSGSGDLLMQCGDYVGTWDIEYLRITHEGKGNENPITWLELLTNGDAEKSWAELGLDGVAFNDSENNYKVCAWSKERGVNLDENDQWNPFPATIEEEADGNHVFVCHGQEAITDGDAAAWDNQFWIESPQSWKDGEQIKLHFRYKASKAVTTQTQTHKQTPSDYLHWAAIGDISFTTEWQEFDKVITWDSNMSTGWSVCFNLNSSDKSAIDFYFDDLSWSKMVLDEGFFVASSNANTGIEYDFDHAIEFVEDGGVFVATVGTEGDESSWVKELMISTVRGNDRAFKSHTLKVSGQIKNDPDAWLNYTEGSNAKISLPVAGVWQITIDPDWTQMNFIKLEGEPDLIPIDIYPNATEVVLHGQERDDIKDDDHPDGTGQPWDNQFFIFANRPLKAGEVTVVQFDYKASVEAKVSTQCHKTPGDYLNSSALGDLTFTTAWQSLEKELTITGEGTQSIAFNMAEIKEACDYEIKNIVWKIQGDYETLIDMEGTKNFYVKEGAGSAPYEFGTNVGPNVATGISNVVVNNAPAATYNLAGQRVSKEYKGIVVKNGNKYIVK